MKPVCISIKGKDLRFAIEQTLEKAPSPAGCFSHPVGLFLSWDVERFFCFFIFFFFSPFLFWNSFPFLYCRSFSLFLFCSFLSFLFVENSFPREPLDRITEIKFIEENGDLSPFEDEKEYTGIIFSCFFLVFFLFFSCFFLVFFLFYLVFSLFFPFIFFLFSFSFFFLSWKNLILLSFSFHDRFHATRRWWNFRVYKRKVVASNRQKDFNCFVGIFYFSWWGREKEFSLKGETKNSMKFFILTIRK